VDDQRRVFLWGSLLSQCHLLCPRKSEISQRLPAPERFSLDKSKKIVYVLMGEHTQSTGFIRPV
ncbi:MAG TPA: hypothetical protein VEO53_16495, partial [Candidatus Binatia bacterium]|nr:hypothetical protein [Candidatus Binatia bacterium]